MLSIASFVLLCSASIATAARLTVSIPPSSLLGSPSSLPASTHAVLVGPPGVRYDVPLRRDNTFTFPGLAEASYLLTVHSRDYFFTPLRVDVTKSGEESQQETVQAWQTFRGNEWSNKGQHYGTGKGELTIHLAPGSSKSFYQVRGGFDALGMLKSPMILMGLVSVAMVFGLPYIMDNSTSEESALRLLLRGTRTDAQQWILRPRQSLTRRCRRRARSRVRTAQQMRYKTSIWQASWLGQDQAEAVDHQEAAGRSEALLKCRDIASLHTFSYTRTYSRKQPPVSFSNS